MVGAGIQEKEQVERMMKPSIKPWRWPDESRPEPHEDVLVITRTGCLYDVPSRDLAYRKRDGTWALTGTDPERVIEPLCWMPMPAMPAVFEEQREQMERYEEYIRRLKAFGEKTANYSCPECLSPLIAAVPPAGQVFDSLVHCPYCSGMHFKQVEADGCVTTTEREDAA
jgi:hypothetical protein